LQQTAIVAGGLGVVALGAGMFFGVQAIRKNDSSKSGCDEANVCDASSRQTRLEARTAGNVSTAAFAGGGARLIGGAIMYLAGAEGASKRAGVRAMPAAGNSELGFRVTGSF